MTDRSPEALLESMGIVLPGVARPVAAYVPAVRTGDLVFVSGQVPVEGGRPTHIGHVGAEVSLEEAQAAARTCCLNGLAALKAEIGDLARVTRVVRLCVYVASAPGFTDQPRVGNGASELLQEIFGESGRHARAAIGVAELPLGVPVEVEFLFEVPDQA